MRKLLLLLLPFTLALFATTASAGCIRCDQWTGYQCFMSVYGTKMFCDNPSNAGCITWGACSSGGECNDDDRCLQEPVALRFTKELQFASMSITLDRRT
jgi:hypothetical protein